MMRRLLKGLVVIVLLLALLLGAVYLFFLRPILNPPGSFSFDRGRFDAVVMRIRQLGIKPGERRELYWANPEDPATVRQATPAEIQARNGTRHIGAQVGADGKLTVLVITADSGHAGREAEIFSDAGLKPYCDRGGYWFLSTPVGTWQSSEGATPEGGWWHVWDSTR